MLFKKIVVVVSSILFFTSLLLSQSLVEVAKKERERRANLKGKKKIVATNADLSKSKRRTATSISGPEILDKRTSPRTEPVRKSSPRVEQSGKSEAEEEKIFKQRQASFEAKLKQAKEFSDLMATKMNGLWQELYNLGNDMTYRGRIQADISETYLKLQRSRSEEAKAKEELDAFLAEARKRGVPPGWLR